MVLFPHFFLRAWLNSVSCASPVRGGSASHDAGIHYIPAQYQRRDGSLSTHKSRTDAAFAIAGDLSIADREAWTGLYRHEIQGFANNRLTECGLRSAIFIKAD